MNTLSLIPPSAAVAEPHRVEFFRLPPPGKRDPYFGLSRGWYYKAASLGEIRMVSLRQRGALRGVRLVVYDSVADYVRRSLGEDAARECSCSVLPDAGAGGAQPTAEGVAAVAAAQS